VLVDGLIDLLRSGIVAGELRRSREREERNQG
jgi:hypothetical protein